MDTSSHIHRFSELSEIREVVQRFGYDVVYTRISPGQLDVEAYEIRVDDCLVYREQFGCHMMAHGTSTPRGFGVTVAQSGVVRFFGTEVSPKKVVLFPPGCEIDAVGSPGLRLLHFLLPEHRVVAAADDLDIKLVHAPRTFVVEPGIDRLHHLQAISDQVTQVLESRDIEAWPEAEQDLVDTFLGLFDIGASHEPRAAGPNGRAAEHAVSAQKYICSAPLDQLDLDGLARDLGIGRHHLNRCFREHYGVGFHEFIRLCRLNRARGLLTGQAAERTVTEAAYACGFNHLGRFAAEYKDLFGEMPSETLRRAAQTK